MRKYHLDYSKRALTQLQGILSYIAENNPDAADKMLDTLESRADLLRDQPLIGVELSQKEFPFLPPGYRKMLVSPFIMYYRVEKKTVFIPHIIRSRRDQAKALKEK